MRTRIASVLLLLVVGGDHDIHGQLSQPPVTAAPSPELIWQPGQSGQTMALQFGGSERWLLVHSMIASRQEVRSQARLIDMRTGRTIRTLDTFLGALHPTKDLIVVARGNSALAMHPVTGLEEWELEVPKGALTIGSLQFDSDGRTLSGTYSVPRKALGLLVGFRTFQLTWSADSGRMLSKPLQLDGTKPLTGARDPVWTVALKSMKTNAMEIEIRDVRSGDRIGPILNNFPLAMHSGVRRIVALDAGTASDGTPVPVAKLLDALTGMTLASVPGYGVDFSRDGSKVAVTTFTGSWILLDSNTGRTLLTAPSDTPYSSKWVFTSDGTRLVGIQQDALLIAHLDAAADVEVLRSGDTPLVIARDYDALYKRALSGESIPAAAATPVTAAVTGRQPLAAGAFTSDGRWFVARASDGFVDLWDLATGNHLPFRLPPTQDEQGPLYVASSDGLFKSALNQRSDFQGSVQTDSDRQDVQEGLRLGSVATSRTPAIGLPCSLATRQYRVGEAPMSDIETQRLQAAVTRAEELGMDPAIGCNLNPTRTQVLVALKPDMAKATQPKNTNALSCLFLLRSCPQPAGDTTGPMQIAILDVASGQVVATLREEDGKSSQNFRNRIGYIHWTLDGQFVVGSMTGAFRGPRFHVWKAGSGERVSVHSELASANVTGLLADRSWVTSSPTGSTTSMSDNQPVDVWDLATMRRVVRLASTSTPRVRSASLNTALVSFTNNSITSNDKVLVIADAGALQIHDLKTGDRLGELRVMDNGEWLVTTPSGLFDGSPGGWRRIAWREGDKEVVESGELFFDEFYRPGLLAELMDGRRVQIARALAVRDRRQPTIALRVEADAASGARLHVQIKQAGTGADGSGVRDVRLFRNGSLVKTWRGEQRLLDGRIDLDATVATVVGKNRFTAYAFNRDNIRSQAADATLDLVGQRRSSTTYVLAIGVDQYANSTFNLNYAAPDATVFAQRVAMRQRELDPTTTIKVVVLLDGDATRDNIVLALRRLSGAAPAALPSQAPKVLEQFQQTTAGDTVFVYFAGHGMAVGERFHLIPSDMSYRGPRDGVRNAIDAVLARSISDTDLETLFEPMDGSDFTLVIDACQSGQAIGSDGERFGPMNSRGLAQLAYEKGMSILTASQAYQAALESAQLGHGYLTFALIEEALASRIADRAPADGAVTVDEWFDHAVGRVPALQLEALGRATQAGRSLRFDAEGIAAPGGSRLQTPRAFRKRDASAPPLVVARP